MPTTVVLSGGPIDPAHVEAAIAGLDVARVIAADSGLHAACAAGLRAEVVIGDMDSVDPDLLADAVAEGATPVRHAVDKDATDLELALDLALDLAGDHTTGAGGPPRGVGTAGNLLVVGSGAGRLDHLLGWVALVASPRYAPFTIEARLGATRVLPVHRSRRLAGEPGALVSLIAVHGPAMGVRTEGLRWALEGETLAPETTLGISNRFAAPEAEVSLDAGVVVVVVPDAEDR